ncbi:MAG: M50 family metallopeptidase [Nitrolancea sp.]
MLAQRSGPEFNILGRMFTVRIPWAVAACAALALTASELAPRESISSHVLLWLLNGAVLTAATIGSILLHEVGHAVVGQRFGRATERISIYPLGGAADDFNEPGSPRSEIVTGIAGPIASGILAGLFASFWALTPASASTLRQDLLFIIVVNGVLAIANLLPGYPLDGGRIFRALVWYLHDDFTAGTRAAVTYGQVISTFGLASALVLLGSHGPWSLVGIWVMLAAWAVARVGRQEMTRSTLLSLGGSLTAGEAVRGLNPHVRADQPLDVALEALLAEMHSGPGLVTRGGDVIGVLSLQELRHFRRNEWSTTPAEKAMIPISQLDRLDQAISVRKLLNVLTEGRTDTLLVVGDDGVVGAINRQIAVEKLVDRVQAARMPR